jgi:hypothetical protein
MRLRQTLAGLILASAVVGTSAAYADGSLALFNYTDQSHVFCPRGATLYWGIPFGYWCEDSTLSGVQPIDCKSGPGMKTGSFNNGSQTPDQLCRGPGSAQPTVPAASN